MDHVISDNSRDSEIIFWINILYSIGSYMIETTRSMQCDDTIELDSKYDDPITCIFCGFWILYTIGEQYK
jgi:hypothetical protein